MIQTHLELFWNGPHDWPKRRQQSPLDDLSGIYIWTVQGNDGFVVYGFGITTRSVSTRLDEHRRKMLQVSILYLLIC